MAEAGKRIDTIPVRTTAAPDDRVLILFNAANTMTAQSATITVSNLLALFDAPNDGKSYVRQNGQWVEIPGG